MKARITVLCENSAVQPMGIIGEHGFAALVERGNEKILFDTGQGYALLHNARIMGIDLSQVHEVALSHGHYDHTGGLAELLKSGGERDIYAHPGIFVARYWRGPDGAMKPIGIPFNRDYLEGLGGRFHLDGKPQEVAEGVFTTGEIEKVTTFEGGDTTMFLSSEPGGKVDPLPDDLSLVIEGEAGLIVLLGCAHAGLVNILRHVEKMRPGKKIHAVLGGTHLGFSGEEQMAGTIEAMKGMGVEKVGAGHCTGLAGSCRLREAVGEDRFFFAGAGAVLEV